MKLEVKKIRKRFEGKEVLKGVGFSVESGRALGLLGRNGAGKTTTIRIIMDIFRADEGEVLLDGTPFDPAKNQVGYLPEERNVSEKNGDRADGIFCEAPGTRPGFSGKKRSEMAVSSKSQ